MAGSKPGRPGASKGKKGPLEGHRRQEQAIPRRSRADAQGRGSRVAPRRQAEGRRGAVRRGRRQGQARGPGAVAPARREEGRRHRGRDRPQLGDRGAARQDPGDRVLHRAARRDGRPRQGDAVDRDPPGDPGDGGHAAGARPHGGLRRRAPGRRAQGAAVRVRAPAGPAREGHRPRPDPAVRRARRHHRPAQPRRDHPLHGCVRRARRDPAAASLRERQQRRVEDERRCRRAHPGRDRPEPDLDAQGVQEAGRVRARPRRRRRRLAAGPRAGRPPRRDRRGLRGQGPVAPRQRDLRPDRLHPDRRRPRSRSTPGSRHPSPSTRCPPSAPREEQHDPHRRHRRNRLRRTPHRHRGGAPRPHGRLGRTVGARASGSTARPTSREPCWMPRTWSPSCRASR